MKMNTNLLILHAAVLLLGMTGLFGKFINQNPLAIILGRTFFTALFLLACITFLKGNLVVRSKKRGMMLVISGAILAAHWFAFFYAIQLSTVAIGVIGFSTFPIFVTLLEPLFFQERYRAVDFVSVFVVFLGLCVVASDGWLFPKTPSYEQANLGEPGQQIASLVWAVLSGLLLAAFTLINRKLVRDEHFFLITFYQNVVAFFCVLPFVWVLGVWPATNEYWLLALLGILFTALPQAMLVRALKHVKAQLTSVIVGLEPIYSILLAVILLNEIPQVLTLVGGTIVAAAVLLATKYHEPTRHNVKRLDIV